MGIKMDGREKAIAHAKAWSSGAGKVFSSLDKGDIAHCFAYTQMHYGLGAEEIGERRMCNLVTSWMMSSFKKEGRPVVDWYVGKYGQNLTPEEKEALVEGKEFVEGFFIACRFGEGEIVLEDPRGKKFAVEVLSMDGLPPGTCLLARLHSKGGGKFFLPGIAAVLGGEETFLKIKRHFRFRDSWGKLIPGFFRHLRDGEGLSERTADKHADNVVPLTFMLEEKMDVDSFSAVTKPMLKTEFRKFVRTSILSRGKIDMEKIYYSLLLFFRYLDEEKGIKNEKVLGWLKNR